MGRKGSRAAPAQPPQPRDCCTHRRHSRAFRQNKRASFRVIVLFGKKHSGEHSPGRGKPRSVRQHCIPQKLKEQPGSGLPHPGPQEGPRRPKKGGRVHRGPGPWEGGGEH